MYNIYIHAHINTLKNICILNIYIYIYINTLNKYIITERERTLGKTRWSEKNPSLFYRSLFWAI